MFRLRDPLAVSSGGLAIDGMVLGKRHQAPDIIDRPRLDSKTEDALSSAVLLDGVLDADILVRGARAAPRRHTLGNRLSDSRRFLLLSGRRLPRGALDDAGAPSAHCPPS